MNISQEHKDHCAGPDETRGLGLLSGLGYYHQHDHADHKHRYEERSHIHLYTEAVGDGHNHTHPPVEPERTWWDCRSGGYAIYQHNHDQGAHLHWENGGLIGPRTDGWEHHHEPVQP